MSLDGVSVSVGNIPAYVYYSSPTQINALAPDSVESNAVAVSNAGETNQAITAAIQTVAPAFFQWPGNYAVATHQDYNLAVKNGTFSYRLARFKRPISQHAGHAFLSIQPETIARHLSDTLQSALARAASATASGVGGSITDFPLPFGIPRAAKSYDPLAMPPADAVP